MRVRHQGSRVFDSAQADPRLRAGLVGWWVGDGAGPTLRDRSGYHNHGPLGDQAWSLGPTPERPAVFFPGTGTSGALVQPSTAYSASANAPISLAVWACTGAVTNDGAYYRRVVDLGSNGFSVVLKAGAPMGYYNGTVELNDTTALAVGQWTHVAFVYDGSTYRLYRNGLETATATTTLGALSAVPVYIGALGGTGLGRFVGSLSDVRLYNRALSSAEIALLASPTFRPILAPRRHSYRQSAFVGSATLALAASTLATSVAALRGSGALAVTGATAAGGPVAWVGAGALPVTARVSATALADYLATSLLTLTGIMSAQSQAAWVASTALALTAGLTPHAQWAATVNATLALAATLAASGREWLSAQLLQVLAETLVAAQGTAATLTPAQISLATLTGAGCTDESLEVT